MIVGSFAIPSLEDPHGQTAARFHFLYWLDDVVGAWQGWTTDALRDGRSNKFGMGAGKVMSRVTIELTQETEAVKVVVTNDEWTDDDPAYQLNADGWPRILSRLKTLLETGKTFRPH